MIGFFDDEDDKTKDIVRKLSGQKTQEEIIEEYFNIDLRKADNLEYLLEKKVRYTQRLSELGVSFSYMQRLMPVFALVDETKPAPAVLPIKKWTDE